MLVTFRTNAYANIVMFGDVAQQLLRLMGHSGTVPGALLAKDVAGALEKLRAGLELTDAEAEQEAANEDADDNSEYVSLRHRAVPLIELLDTANREQDDVLWE
jgi:hypothetical protein